ncbi:MAG: hypothetical protein AAFV45_13565 [Pseudomonadota bacterium]
MFQAFRSPVFALSALAFVPFSIAQPVLADPTASAHVSVEQSEKQRLVSELFEVALFDESLDGWQKMFLSLDPSQCACPGQEDADGRMARTWAQSVAQAFQPEGVSRQVQYVFARTFSVAELKKLIDLANRPLVKRFAAATVATNSLDMPDEALVAAILSQTQRAQSDAALQFALQDIIDTAGFTSEATNAIIEMSIGMTVGILTATPDGMPRADESQIVSEVESTRDQTYYTVQATMLGSAAFAYRDFSVEALREYAEVLRDPLMSRSTDVMATAMSAALRLQGKRIGFHYGRLINAVDL